MESIQQDFIAWSLHTGPTVHPIQIKPSVANKYTNDMSWTFGVWNGCNKDTTSLALKEQKEEIKKDLEARIELVIEVFKQSIPLYKTADRHFVLPEFFFHCTFGPYPHLQLQPDKNKGWEFIDSEDGNLRTSATTKDVKLFPFEYLIARLSYEFRECILKHDKDEKNIYNIVIGSVLTSNQADYKKFLESPPVVQRTAELNTMLTEFYAKFLEIWKKGKQSQQAITEGIAVQQKNWDSFARSRRGFNNLISLLRQELLQKNMIPDEFDNIAATFKARLERFMKQREYDPLCTVRNRGAYFYFRTCTPPGEKVPKRMMQVYRYEKQNQSPIDLLMGTQIHFDMKRRTCTVEVGNMVTEWMCNYPAYTLYLGDKHIPFKPNDNSAYPPQNDLYDDHQYQARFTPIGVENNGFTSQSPSLFRAVDFGVEICMDHSDQRLRRTVEMTRATTNYPLYKQIIPSCGAPILSESVAAHSNSVIFHVDGECTFNNEQKSLQDKGIYYGVYTILAQSLWDSHGQKYGSHSQIAFTTENSSIHGFNNALGFNNEMAGTYNGTTENPSNRLTDSYEVQIFHLHSDATPFEDLGEVFEKSATLFAAGVGELHYYGPK